MVLTRKAKEKLAIERNKFRLCEKIGISYPTICRWISNDDEKLTLKKSIIALCEVLEMTEEQIFKTTK